MRLYDVPESSTFPEGDVDNGDDVWDEKLRYYSLAMFMTIMVWTLGRFVVTVVWNKVSDARFRAAANDSLVVNPFHNGVTYPVSYWSDPGRRNYQEDTHKEYKGRGNKDSSLYGVFDGHGGYDCAYYRKWNWCPKGKVQSWRANSPKGNGAEKNCCGCIGRLKTFETKFLAFGIG